MGREFELKFSVRDGTAEAVIAHPLVRAAFPGRRTDHLVSTYFDTPDTLLRRSRVSLRVRRSATDRRQTIKSAGASLVDRAEYETVVEGNEPDGAWLRETPLRKLFKGDTLERLAPLFTVDVSRTTVPIEYGGATIEGALDQGAIRADGSSLAISEFELELKSGRSAKVLALARTLARDLPLTLSLASKSERGYGLSDHSWGRPSKEIAPDLSAARTIGDAFTAIVQACLHAICNNAALVGTSRDEDEAVHKTRVAVRHLRAALDLFAPALRRGRLAATKRELKWISDRLGAARDADVFQSGVFDKAAADGATPGAVALAERERQRRAALHLKLSRALASRRWRLLLLDLLTFSTEGVRASRCREAYKPFVRRRIAKRLSAVANGARGLRKQSEERRHTCRKRAKMLRYALDFFPPHSGVAGKARHHKAIGQALGTLQQDLGAVHDHDALREHLKSVQAASVREHAHAKAIAPSSGGGPADEDRSEQQKAAAALLQSGPDLSKCLKGSRKAGKTLRRLARAVA